MTIDIRDHYSVVITGTDDAKMVCIVLEKHTDVYVGHVTGNTPDDLSQQVAQLIAIKEAEKKGTVKN